VSRRRLSFSIRRGFVRVMVGSGLWMGGNVPLGYDASERTLVINPVEAQTVCRIFALYCEFGGVRRVKEEADRLGLRTKRRTTANGAERGGKPFSRGHIYALLSNPIYTGRIAHKGELYPGQHPALIDDETWAAVRGQLAANASNHQRKGKAAEPSLLAGLLVDAQGERLTPSHAVKKGRRYRYYVSAALITEAGTDRAQGFRLAAREIEDAVIRILSDALTNPAKLLDRLGTAASSDKIRKILGRANRLAVAHKGSPGEQSRTVRELVEKVLVGDNTIMIRVRRRSLVDRDVTSSGSEDPIELTERLALKRHGVETKLVLPGLAQQHHNAR
jgi:site-specific DNA recombinase